MKWYKYKQGASAHIDKDWNFILVPDSSEWNDIAMGDE